MSFTLLKGHFVPRGGIHDGDSVGFRATNLSLSKKLEGRFCSATQFAVAALAVVIGATAPISARAQVPEAAAQADLNAYREVDTGWLEREIYRSPAEDPIRVEFIDVLVGARRIANVKAMPSAALLDVKAGQASVTVDRRQQRSTAGTVIRIDQGQALSIDNRKSERSFVARLIRITAAR